MNQPAQQIPSNPALDFANAILEETNNGLELIEILHDIAQGIDERATTNDRITAANILADRGLGKCPKQPPAPNPNPASRAQQPQTQNHRPTRIPQARNPNQRRPARLPRPSPHPKHNSADPTIHQPLSTTNYHPTTHPRKSPITARP